MCVRTYVRMYVRCCFVPIIINSVLSEFSSSLLDFIRNEMSVRKSLYWISSYVYPIVIVLCKPVCHQHTCDD